MLIALYIIQDSLSVLEQIYAALRLMPIPPYIVLNKTGTFLTFSIPDFPPFNIAHS